MFFITNFLEPLDSPKCYSYNLRVKRITRNHHKNRTYWHNKLAEAMSACTKSMSMRNQNRGITSEKGIWRHVSFAFYHILVAYGLVYNTN